MTLDALRASLSDRYTLERELGQGGMATVYLAHDLKHDRKVAIKVLRPELAAVIGAERFLSEIRTTANLQHPHILPLFDSGAVRLSHPERSALGEAEGHAVEGSPALAVLGGGDIRPTTHLYYVMPFVEGESLRDRLDREKQLPIADAVRLATEVASALDYAHRRGIIHRDIKPENILLHDGQALVADFGIALAASGAGSRMTETGMSLGTPHYMSPEQAMGERELDARSDVYALGAMTYEMLVGDPPFTGSTAQSIVAKVMTEKPVPPSRARDTIPEAVEDAVLTALQKLPADRFASATQFSQALVAPPASGRSTGTSAATNAASVVGRRMVPIAALAALVGAVVGAAAIWFWRSPAREVPPLPLHVEVMPPDSVSLRVICCGQMFAISPDGRWLLFQGSPRVDSSSTNAVREMSLYLRDLTELRTRRLPGTANATSMFFAPSGDQIGFVANQKLWRLSLTGAEPQLIAAVPEGFVGGGNWSDDGDITLAVSGQMLQVPATGGSLTPLFSVDSTQQLGGPQQYSREQVLLYTIASFAGVPQVHWRSLKTGASRVVADGATPTYVPTQRALLLVSGYGALMRYPFDLATGDTTGPGTVVANGIERRSPVLLHGEYAVSATGTLVQVKRLATTSLNGISMVTLSGEQSLAPEGFPGALGVTAMLFAKADSRLLLAGLRSGALEPYVFDVERGALSRVPIDGQLNAMGWAPGGDSILYATRQSGNQLYVRAIDGSGTPSLSHTLRDGTFAGTLSSWGPWVAFSAQLGTEVRRLGVAHRDSLDTVRWISQSGTEERTPAISPDGKWLAFTATENGREEVFVTTFPRPDGRSLVSIGGGRDPNWGRDARTLYYQQGNEIMVTSIAPGTTPVIGAPRRHYRRDPWGFAAVSSDGQRLVFADVVREGAPVALTVRLQAVRGAP